MTLEEFIKENQLVHTTCKKCGKRRIFCLKLKDYIEGYEGDECYECTPEENEN